MSMQGNVEKCIIACHRLKIGISRNVVLEELRDALMSLVGCNPKWLQPIIINPNDDVRVPDVLVIPGYDEGGKLPSLDIINYTNFGVYLEIKETTIRDYTAEELTACIVHDMLHNVCSNTALERALKAWNIVNETRTLREEISEATEQIMHFLLVADICFRTFKVSPMESGMGADEVLVGLGLGKHYASYLAKYYATTASISSKATTQSVEGYMDVDVRLDIGVAQNLIHVANDRAIASYAVTIANSNSSLAVKAFFPTAKRIQEKLTNENNNLDGYSLETLFDLYTNGANWNPMYRNDDRPDPDRIKPIGLSESVHGVKFELEMQYKIDSMANDLRHMETEDDRQIMLYRIKAYRVALAKRYDKVNAKIQKTTSPSPNDMIELDTIKSNMDKLNVMRQSCLDAKITKTQFGLFVKYPANYEG